MQNQIVNTIALPKKIVFLVNGINLQKPFSENVQVLNAEQKTQLASHLADVCDQLIDKELLGLDLTHRILKCYNDVESEETLKSFVQNRLPVDGVPYLLSSKPGNDALVRFLGFITAKQRKDFARHLKGKWLECSMNLVNFIFVIRFLETIDDTVLAAKCVTKELIGHLPRLMKDKCGRKVIGALLTAPDSALRKRFLGPVEQDGLRLAAPTALKDPKIRREEIAKPLLAAMEPLITSEKVLEFATDTVSMDLIVAFFDGVGEDHASRRGFVDVMSKVLVAPQDNMDGTIVRLLSTLIKTSASIRDSLWEAIQPHIALLLPTKFCLALLALIKVKPEVRATLLEHKALLREDTGALAKQLLGELESTA